MGTLDLDRATARPHLGPENLATVDKTDLSALTGPGLAWLVPLSGLAGPLSGLAGPLSGLDQGVWDLKTLQLSTKPTCQPYQALDWPGWSP